MNETSFLKLLPESDSQIVTFCDNIKNTIETAYENGDIDTVLDVELLLSNMEKTAERLRKDSVIKGIVLTCADKKNDGKTFEYRNVNIQIASRSKHDFSVCKDYDWQQLQKQQEELKKKIKDREDFLLTLKNNDVITRDGVILQPPHTTYTNYLKLQPIKS